MSCLSHLLHNVFEAASFLSVAMLQLARSPPTDGSGRLKHTQFRSSLWILPGSEVSPESFVFHSTPSSLCFFQCGKAHAPPARKSHLCRICLLPAKAVQAMTTLCFVHPDCFSEQISSGKRFPLCSSITRFECSFAGMFIAHQRWLLNICHQIARPGQHYDHL